MYLLVLCVFVSLYVLVVSVFGSLVSPAFGSIYTCVCVGVACIWVYICRIDSFELRYGKERYAYRRDLAIQKLGFSTDNGAYYYYHTEENDTKTAEQTLVDVQVRKRAFSFSLFKICIILPRQTRNKHREPHLERSFSRRATASTSAFPTRMCCWTPGGITRGRMPA